MIYGSHSNYVNENLGPHYILVGELIHIFFPNKYLNKFMSFNFMPHLGAKTIQVDKSLFLGATRCYLGCPTLHLGAYKFIKHRMQPLYI
jgi:hypothetical protein